VSASAQADAQTTSQIVNALSDYARQHGTWDGVTAALKNQADQTGQRIKIVAETGEIIADTDILAGHTARPVTTPPMLLDRVQS
jgi:two-component system sensor histidine kinase BaeS